MRHSHLSDHVTKRAKTVGASDVRAELDRILKSRPFRNSERLQRFLKFAVECALEGTIDQLKESVIGRTVFDRGSKYDPRTDSIVRVESQRLRKKLREYYEIEGRGDKVSIVFQPGSYVPAFGYLTNVRVRTDEESWPEGPSPSPQTIAILPLSNLSGDPRQEFFCDGITDDIIYALSCIPGLNVIGHTSVFAFRGAALDARVIGGRLAAGTVIDGSVRKSGSRLKIFVEMLDASSGQVRWAKTFDRTLRAVFRVEEEIAQAVKQAVQMTLTPPPSGRLIRGAPDMDAYQLYLQGRYAWHRMSEEGYRTAAEIFERAISLFPTYAPSYAGLADAYSYLAFWGYARPRETFPKARRSALQGLKLDACLPHANTALAVVTACYERKWVEAAGLARKATEFEPSYAFGQQVYGCCLLALGELGQGCARLERGVVLDPLSVRANRLVGWGLYLQRRTSDAKKWLEAALVLNPRQETRYLLAQVCLSEGRLDEALEHARQCQTDPPYALGLGVLGACLARLNHRKEALEIVVKLSRLAEAGYVDPRAMTHIKIALDDTEGAIESVQRILDERAPLALFLKLDPELDPLRNHPRFAALVARLGL